MNLEDRLSLLLDLLLNNSESGIRKLSEQEIQGGQHFPTGSKEFNI